MVRIRFAVSDLLQHTSRFHKVFAAAGAFVLASGRDVSRGEQLVREIEAQDRKLIFFVDDNFLSDHESAKAFLRELIPMRIRWVSQASIDMTNRWFGGVEITQMFATGEAAVQTAKKPDGLVKGLEKVKEDE